MQKAPSEPSSGNYLAVRDDWLALHKEEILEPALPIIDAHHHFYDRPGWTYLADEYRADAGSGHKVRASVYMQALTRYRADGPQAMKPVGETDYVLAATEGKGGGLTKIAQGIVGYANLRLGAAVRDVLEAHVQAGKGRFRGIRHLTAWDADPSLVNPLTAAPSGLLLDRAYREGVAQLAPLGLSYDAWLFFPQLRELFDLAGQGRIDLFFLGGAQIDGEANINLVQAEGKRFPGSFGSAFMYFAAGRTILFREEHSKRVLVPKVEFISAPGWSPPGVERRGGPQALLTGKALFGWQPQRRRFRLESIHPGHDLGEILVTTGFDFDRGTQAAATPVPSNAELALLRGEVAKEISANYPEFAARVWGGQ